MSSTFGCGECVYMHSSRVFVVVVVVVVLFVAVVSCVVVVVVLGDDFQKSVHQLYVFELLFPKAYVCGMNFCLNQVGVVEEVSEPAIIIRPEQRCQTASTPLGWTLKTCSKNRQSFIENHTRQKCSESAGKRRIALYKSHHQQQQLFTTCSVRL